ncbi:MAG: glycosyltransferase family 4 protein [Leptolyngbya sp. Prado105]|jgi:glycosyltransferase involved in cell wall biosynthesis|nr:glycosyltransferase family 4 protein [Leptolyngbya sp. Prado105]
MRIAQIAPLWETVPPPAYGGAELVVSLLTEELVRRGHEVTLFATGDSTTQAKLEAIHPSALRLDPAVKEHSVYEAMQLNQVYSQAEEFDIIHSHIGFAALACAQIVKTPTVHTLHGTFSLDNQKAFSLSKSQAYVSISNTQREQRLGLNYVATVYNGIDPSTHQFYPKPDHLSYLAFLGRLSPEKGPHHAIEIAKRTGHVLKMAGKIDRVDIDYFEQEIKPHIDGQQIQYLGEANHVQKNYLMGNAIATLFPITWREPFGLVMVESMVAGTPVVALALGATSEVIAHEKTGFLCQTIDECVAAVHRIDQLDRVNCRKHVEENFSVKQMVDGYEAVYRELLAGKFVKNGHCKDMPTLATLEH